MKALVLDKGKKSEVAIPKAVSPLLEDFNDLILDGLPPIRDKHHNIDLVREASLPNIFPIPG